MLSNLSKLRSTHNTNGFVGQLTTIFGCFYVVSFFSNLLDESSQKYVFLYDVPTAQGLALKVTSENWLMQVNKTSSDSVFVVSDWTAKSNFYLREKCTVWFLYLLGYLKLFIVPQNSMWLHIYGKFLTFNHKNKNMKCKILMCMRLMYCKNVRLQDIFGNNPVDKTVEKFH